MWVVEGEGFGIGRKHVGTLIYPYLLRQTKVDRANQAWAMDITSIPMAKG